MEYECKKCGKKFNMRPSRKQKYCSRKCYCNGSKENIICSKCGKVFENYISDYSKYCSRKCFYESMKNTRIGKENPYWKGDNVKYRALHQWVDKILGKPNKCFYCKTEESKMFIWHNISGEYKRDKNDWIRLCSKCHINYHKGNICLE